MADPSWLNDAVAAMMLAVAVCAAGRMVAAGLLRRGTSYDIDLAYVLIGVALAGRFARRLDPLPWWGWTIVFTVLTSYFLARTVSAARHHHRVDAAHQYLPHTVYAAAMVYIATAAPVSGAAISGAGGLSGSVGARLPTLALMLAPFVVGYTVVLTDSLTSRVTGQATAGRVALAPRAGTAYQIVTSIGVGLMLVFML